MSTIPTPQKVFANLERGTSTLFFPPNDLFGASGEFYLRGGICWPRLLSKPDAMSPVIQGFALMIGLYVPYARQYSKLAMPPRDDAAVPQMQAYVFEETEFKTIEDIIKERGDNGIESHFSGIGRWFNNVWSNYYADAYFEHDRPETVERYHLQVYRSEMLKPKPHFIDMEWQEDEQAVRVIWEWGDTGRLTFRKDGPLHTALRQYRVAPGKQPGKKPPPAIHALTCVLMGLERYPWRRSMEEDVHGTA